MFFYLKLGLRNLLKNYRRSFKTIITVVIGLSACLLFQGFMSYTIWGLRESLINGGLGQLQIYRKGYLKHSVEEPYGYLITDSKSILRELQKVPQVKLCAPRLSFQGIVSSGEKSAVFMGTGGLAMAEEHLNTFTTLKEGVFIKGDQPYGVVIGSGLAKKLNVGAGDTVTLMATLKDGGVNALDMEVKGIIEAQIKAYNDVALLANLETAQSFLDRPNSVDRIVLLLTATKNLAKITPFIKRFCDPRGLEYSGWRQLAGDQYARPKLFYDLVYMLFMIIIVLMVIFSIINTLNLSVAERVREIGAIRSLGTTRLQVGKIFIAESFLIGLGGSFFGILAGYGLAALFNFWGGIPIPPPPGQARGYIAFFKPDLLQALQLGMLFLTTAALGGFYPAFRAARLPIVTALRRI